MGAAWPEISLITAILITLFLPLLAVFFLGVAPLVHLLDGTRIVGVCTLALAFLLLTFRLQIAARYPNHPGRPSRFCS